MKAGRKIGDGGPPWCCFMGCEKDAEYDIFGESNYPDDNTQSCEDHIGALLGTPGGVPKENNHWTVSRLVARAASVKP